MNNWRLISSVLQIAVGVGAIAAYAAVASSGEDLGRWTVTLLLAIAFAVIGVIGLIDLKKSKNNKK